MHHSLWLDQYNMKGFPELNNDLEVDILVVGGGITGITSALLLVEEGFKVAIVEKFKLMHGTTGHTTAKVTIQHGIVYQDLIKRFGVNNTQLYVDSNIKAHELIKENIKTLEIDCDYEEVTSFIYTQKTNKLKKIENEYKAALKLNIDSFLTDQLKLPFDVKGAIGFKNQAHFNVTKYLHKLIEEFDRNDDSYIFEHSKVMKVTEEDDKCISYLDNGVKVKSRFVVMASHYPVNCTYNMYFSKLKPSITYLIAAKHHVPLDNGDYINVEKPTRSLRTQVYHDDRLLLIAGENHQTGHKSDNLSHFDNLEIFGREYFKIEKPLYRFSTQDYYTFDKLPYIGRLNLKSPHIIVATGYKKWGMTTSHVAAILARDLITNKKTAYEDLYDPIRLSDKINCKYFMYNLKSIKCFITDRIKSKEREFDVEKGMGKVVSYKGKKYGVYKDDEGKTYIVDVVCPHLKCILSFNPDHKTYDCPCHGSRFTYKGKYIDGPSIKDLKRINFKDIN